MTNDLKELIERAKGIDGDFAKTNPGLTMQYVHTLVERLEADLCAVVKPLEWSDRRNSVYQAGDYQVCLNASPHHYDLYWRVRKNEKVICKKIKGLDKAKAWAQLHHKDSILSTLTIRSASDVAAEARAGAIEAAAYVARNACLVPPDGGSPTQAEADVCDEAYRRIRAIHDTDTLAAIERIKEQARREERERCHNAIMAWDIEAYYSEGGRIQFDDLQEFFAATVDEAIRKDEW